MGTFTDNIARLEERLAGKWQGKVEVDQIYAHYQHEHPEFHHPDGGKAFYLRDPLFYNARRYLGMVADSMLGEGGVTEGLKQAMEHLSKEVYNQAPWEFADLRASGHPSVTRDGAKVYDRAPYVHRLDSLELRAKAELRYLFDPNRYAYDRRA